MTSRTIKRTIRMAEVREIAEKLRGVLADIDAGRVVADDVQRAFIAGSVHTLDQLTGTGTGTAGTARHTNGG